MASRLQRGVLDTPQLTHCLLLCMDGDVLVLDELEDGLGNMPADNEDEEGDDVDGGDDPRL